MSAASKADIDKRELSSLKRGLRALKMLNRTGWVTATALANELALPRTSARRILDTLVAEGVAYKVPNESTYRLAPSAALLSTGVRDQIVTSHVASPLLYAMTHEIGWALSVVTLDGDDVVVQVATHAESPFALSQQHAGSRTPIAHSVAGMAFLAFLPQDERDAVMARIGSKVTVNVEPAAVIQAQGFSNPAAQQGRQAVVCLPMAGAGRVRACLVMHYIKSALSFATIERDFIPRLRTLAEEISSGVQAVFESYSFPRLPRYLPSAPSAEPSSAPLTPPP